MKKKDEKNNKKKTRIEENAKNAMKVDYNPNKLAQKQVKKLSKKPKIQGVTGIFHAKILEKISGYKDAKQNQIRKNEKNDVSTPEIINKTRCVEGYKNKIIDETIAGLLDILGIIASLIEELQVIQNREEREISSTGEQEKRDIALKELHKRVDGWRVENIRIFISHTRELLMDVDVALNNNLNRADNILHSHISSYWKGVLKAGNKDLPLYPKITEPENIGYDKYKIYMKEIDERITMILEDRFYEEGDEVYEKYEYEQQ